MSVWDQTYTEVNFYDEVQKAKDIVERVKLAICCWAFIHPNELNENASLAQLRPEFGVDSKMAMLVGLDEFYPMARKVLDPTDSRYDRGRIDTTG